MQKSYYKTPATRQVSQVGHREGLGLIFWFIVKDGWKTCGLENQILSKDNTIIDRKMKEAGKTAIF